MVRSARGLVAAALAALGIAGISGEAIAVGIVTILPDDNTGPVLGAPLSDPSTGETMDGALVTVTYKNSPILGGGFQQETILFQSTGLPGQGSAVGTHFSLELTGDSSANDWLITVFANCGSCLMTRMEIDLFSGAAAWDRTNPSPGTLNSGPGIDFTLTSFSTLSDFDVTYRNPVNPIGPPNDAFTLLDIVMSMDVSDTATFRADTDTVVPEPGPAALLAMGLIGLAARQRWRHKPTG